MNITKNKINDYSYQFILETDEENKFMIHYAAGDLYWTMLDYHDNNEFVLTKNDNILFILIDELFHKIEKDDNYKFLNKNYFEWLSEAYGLPEEAHKLTILKDKDKYIIKFYQNPNKKFNVKDICAICFCLSGSKYPNIANAFSTMFYKLSENIKYKTRVLK